MTVFLPVYRSLPHTLLCTRFKIHIAINYAEVYLKVSYDRMVRGVHCKSWQMVAYHAVLQVSTTTFFFTQHGASFRVIKLPELKSDTIATLLLRIVEKNDMERWAHSLFHVKKTQKITGIFRFRLTFFLWVSLGGLLKESP